MSESISSFPTSYIYMGAFEFYMCGSLVMGCSTAWGPGIHDAVALTSDFPILEYIYLDFGASLSCLIVLRGIIQ